MTETKLLLAAAAAFYFGRGYYVNTGVTVPGKDTPVHLAAVLPRMRELKLRMRKGFAPTGIINHLDQSKWLGLSQLAGKTGYAPDFIAAVMTDAAMDDWIESRVDGGEIFYRIKNYRVPARECLSAFAGTENVSDRIDLAESLRGCFNRIVFIFPYAVDEQTMDRITAMGGGVMRFHQKQGVFQEIIPEESLDIEDMQGHASLVESVLYDNVWLMNQELI